MSLLCKSVRHLHSFMYVLQQPVIPRLPLHWEHVTVVLIYLIVDKLRVRLIIIMTTTIELNCWIIGDDPGRIFPVRIERTESVDVLKKAIKEEMKPALDNVLVLILI